MQFSAGVEDGIRHMNILESYVGLSIRMGVFGMESQNCLVYARTS